MDDIWAEHCEQAVFGGSEWVCVGDSGQWVTIHRELVKEKSDYRLGEMDPNRNRNYMQIKR